jgi:hypothetical protein
MKTVAIVDTSWMMYAFKFGLRDLTITRVINGVEVVHPVGHVYGSLTAISMLSQQYDFVLLAVDSVAFWRHKILPVRNVTYCPVPVKYCIQ